MYDLDRKILGILDKSHGNLESALLSQYSNNLTENALEKYENKVIGM